MIEPMLKKLFRRQNTDTGLPEGLRVYAIGDIHGRADLLDELLSIIQAQEGLDGFKPDNEGATRKTRLVFLGDYIDRGPDSRAVIDRLTTLKKERPETIFLKGNHEAALLNFLEKPTAHEEWLHWGGVETMESYGLKNVWQRDSGSLADQLSGAMPSHHLAFLKSLRLTFSAGDYFFVHAGVRPGIDLGAQKEDDLLWIRSAFHNMPVKSRPDKVIVHGHQPMKKPLDANWRIAVDTGACWSGNLTAVVLEGAARRFISTG